MLHLLPLNLNQAYGLLTLMGDPFLNLDLNQQPVPDPPPSSTPATTPPAFGLFLPNHETPPRPIEDRIRFAIRVSGRHPQRSMTSSIEPFVGVNHKRDITHLAKALEMDLDGNKIGGCDNGVVFDCNICLSIAKDPILTCCGHLFCWGCFYLVPYVDSVSKECPVCNGEVIDGNVTPVYGNGNGNGNGKRLEALELSSGVRVPPRPQAHRVESIGQRSLLYNSVVHASVSIPSVAQRDAAGATGLLLGGLEVDGNVDSDVAVSSSRRRRRRRLR